MPAKDEIATFIRTTFPSVWALDLLLLLRAEQGRALSRTEMVVRLRGSELAIAQGIEALAKAGLVREGLDGAAHYAPGDTDLDDLAARTEARYTRKPGAVRRLIASSG